MSARREQLAAAGTVHTGAVTHVARPTNANGVPRITRDAVATEAMRQLQLAPALLAGATGPHLSKKQKRPNDAESDKMIPIPGKLSIHVSLKASYSNAVGDGDHSDRTYHRYFGFATGYKVGTPGVIYPAYTKPIPDIQVDSINKTTVVNIQTHGLVKARGPDPTEGQLEKLRKEGRLVLKRRFQEDKTTRLSEVEKLQAYYQLPESIEHNQLLLTKEVEVHNYTQGVGLKDKWSDNLHPEVKTELQHNLNGFTGFEWVFSSEPMYGWDLEGKDMPSVYGQLKSVSTAIIDFMDDQPIAGRKQVQVANPK